LKRIFPESLSIRADVTRGGTFTPNLESILELHPDVVIQWTQPADLIESLESAGIKVVGLINSPKTQAINEKNLAIVGELLGRRERTGALMDRFHSVMDRIESVTAAIPAKERPRTLYFRSVRDGGMRPAGRKVYQDFWMTLAGGQNVAGGSFEGLETAVNVEQILAWNPEIIFVGAFDNGTPADFMDNPALAEIEAVRNRRVYKLPHGGYRWDPGSHESFLTWMWAAMLTQPKRFDFDLRQAMVDGYRFLYHYNLSEAEIDEILQMKDNGSMAEYDRFTGKR
jgi:iron complex transport system substrate-binding protein